MRLKNICDRFSFLGTVTPFQIGVYATKGNLNAGSWFGFNLVYMQVPC